MVKVLPFSLQLMDRTMFSGFFIRIHTGFVAVITLCYDTLVYQFILLQEDNIQDNNMGQLQRSIIRKP